MISSSDNPCACSSAMYSLPYRPGVGCLNRPLLTADVTKTVSPHTTGDDQPCPAMGTAHLTCSVADHRSGIRAVAATPLISCPRKPGQVSSGFGVPAATVTARLDNETNAT